MSPIPRNTFFYGDNLPILREMPPTNITFKQAQRTKVDSPQQQTLFGEG